MSLDESLRFDPQLSYGEEISHHYIKQGFDALYHGKSHNALTSILAIDPVEEDVLHLEANHGDNESRYCIGVVAAAQTLDFIQATTDTDLEEDGLDYDTVEGMEIVWEELDSLLEVDDSPTEIDGLDYTTVDDMEIVWKEFDTTFLSRDKE